MSQQDWGTLFTVMVGVLSPIIWAVAAPALATLLDKKRWWSVVIVTSGIFALSLEWVFKFLVPTLNSLMRVQARPDLSSPWEVLATVTIIAGLAVGTTSLVEG